MLLKLFLLFLGIFWHTQASQITDQEQEEWTKVILKKLNTLLDYNSQLSQRLNQLEISFKGIKCGGDDHSGWTVIQRRKDVSKNFNRSWLEYKRGFGNKNGDFFIGLEKLHDMTAKVPHELRIELVDDKNNIYYANYDHFVVGSESEQYELKDLGSYNGLYGNFIGKDKGNKFTTYDRDNDRNVFENCAVLQSSGWWFDKCSDCNLNAKPEKGIYCHRPILLSENIFQSSLMMIRAED